MRRELQVFSDFLSEIKDPSYYQETFYFTVLISMAKDLGGSRDETKNDIRALPEILTVTLVEKEKGGVQRDLGTKFLSTLKLHVRKPKAISKEIMMKRTVELINGFKGVSVLRYKERKPATRRKRFYGAGSYSVTEGNYQDLLKKKSSSYTKMKKRLLGKGGQPNVPPYTNKPSYKRGKSAPPGFGSIGEGVIDESMKTAVDIPDNFLVVLDERQMPVKFKVYFASPEDLKTPLRADEEDSTPFYGYLEVDRMKDEPYLGVYKVSVSEATKGFGPILYDVAMEYASKNGGGLKPDVNSVSADASSVWKFYSEKRDDVEKKELDKKLSFYFEAYHDKEISANDLGEYIAERGLMPISFLNNIEDFVNNERHLTKRYVKKDAATTNSLGDKLFILKSVEQKPAPRKPISLKSLDRLMREEISIHVSSQKDYLTFELQPELNQKIWDKDRGIHPGVKSALMNIVEEFIEDLALDTEVKDVIFTGSLANYNWSKFSDIDIHIILDFSDIGDNEEITKRFFDSVRSNWNKLHNIIIKGHEVELYIQSMDEPHVSTGVYSLLDDKWLVKPTRVKPEVDKEGAQKKAIYVAREVDKLESLLYSGDHKQALALAEKMKEKISKMRKAGLEKTGIYSAENLAFKVLRRGGVIKRLHDAYNEAYDTLLSMDQ
jgi:predicted nucleotidyltransferase